MNVGDYVRTKNGELGKLVNVEIYYVLGQNDKDKFSCVLFNNSYIPCIVSNDFIIKKGQLIDLIEVGDYVNGTLVGKIEDIYTTDNIYIGKFLYEKNRSLISGEEDIKSIVTKEQFENIKYDVGE